MTENIFNLPSEQVQNETKNVLQQIANTLGTSIDTVSRMSNVEELVKSVIDGDITNVLSNELVATDIANKLNAKEIEYAPRLTTVEKISNNNENIIYSSNKNVLTVQDVNMTYADSQGYLIQWLDKDGVIYATKDRGLYQSIDNGENYTMVYTFEQIVSGVRSLDNGELIVAIEKTSTIPSRVYKSSNNKTVFNLVLTTSSLEISIHGGWGMDVKGDNVVISEYGTYNYAIYAYLSKDGGNTFDTILNLKEIAPLSTIPHIHGIAYDEYFDRVWITHGDHDSNVYYTDNFGLTWIKAYSHSQLLNIFVMDDCVLFGSDSAPNGIFRYNRGRKEDVAVIELAYKLDDYETITYIPYSTYRRDNKSPVIMTFMFMEAFSQPTGSKIIVTTLDGREFQRIWTDAGSHTVSQPIAAYAPTNDGKLIGTQRGDGRYTNPTLISGNFNYGFFKNNAILSKEYQSQSRKSYIDARSLGLKGNGADESRVLEAAINYVADNHSVLVIPKEMTIMVKNVTIKDKGSFDIVCDGTIKLASLAAGSNAKALYFINCSDIRIPIINFDGNIVNGVTVQKLHQYITLENCNNINIVAIHVKNIGGNTLVIDGSDSITIDTIVAKATNTGTNIIYIIDGENIKFGKIISKNVGDNSFDNSIIRIQPIKSANIIKNVTFDEVDISTLSSKSIVVKNTVGAIVDKLTIENTDIYIASGHVATNGIVEFLGVTNLNADISIDANKTDPATYTGKGIIMSGVTNFDIKAKLKKISSGLYLGETATVENGVINAIVSDVSASCIHFGKMTDVTIEADLNNATLYNMTLLTGNALVDVLVRNSKFRKGTNPYRNINLYNATCTNVVFRDNDFTEWTTIVEKLEINLPGVTRINNRGLNNLSTPPDSRYWNVGEIIYNTTPTAGGYLGWVCITAGQPGIWKGFGLIEA